MGGLSAPRIAVLGGDGIGPEVARAAVRVVEAVGRGWEAPPRVEHHPVGWAAVRAAGRPLPHETREACLEADAVFLGAVGDPAADGEPPELRPERGLLELRRALGCWANLRPVRIPEALVAGSALRPEGVRGTDLLFVRELGGGLYYGEPRGGGDDEAWNTLRYTGDEVRRIAALAFELAESRAAERARPDGGAEAGAPARGRARVTSVDKANVLEASRLWRRVVEEVHEARYGDDRSAGTEGPAPTLDHMLVDRAAMELVLRPTALDVVVTSNLFGDILSDAAGALAGSLGVLGSASLGGTTDLYEPVHGSAPDLAGRGVANPVGALASVALMLRHTLERPGDARRVEAAVEEVLAAGVRTPDLAGPPGSEPVDTDAFTEAVLRRLEASRPAQVGP